MQKIPKGIIAIATVIVLTGVVFYYQFFGKETQPVDQATSLPLNRPESMTSLASKEVSTETTYVVPEADLTHHIKFTVGLDETGRVVDVRMVEMPKGEATEKQQEFASTLTVMIKGKKLAELSQVDKVGKSTLTTEAFNAALGDLKAQL